MRINTTTKQLQVYHSTPIRHLDIKTISESWRLTYSTVLTDWLVDHNLRISSWIRTLSGLSLPLAIYCGWHQTDDKRWHKLTCRDHDTRTSFSGSSSTPDTLTRTDSDRLMLPSELCWTLCRLNCLKYKIHHTTSNTTYILTCIVVFAPESDVFTEILIWEANTDPCSFIL